MTTPCKLTATAMILRTATADDIPAIGDLMVASASGLSAGFYDAQQTADSAQFLTVPDPDIIADGTYYVIEEDGLIACGGWSARRKLFTGSAGQEGLSAERLDPATEPARIRAFFVHPHHARRGLGRMLYDRCEEAALAAGFQSFELMATLPGVPFYTSLGFTAHEPVPIDLPNGRPLPCRRMERQIP